MKLYSRSTLVWALISGLLFSAVLALGGFVWYLKAEEGHSVTQTAQNLKSPALPAVQTGVNAISLQDDFSAEEKQNISIYESLNAGVVNITTEVLGYNWFLDAVPQSGGTGSGSIIDKKGYVLTNQHVVNNAVKVTITLADGTQFDGETIGKDPENDLAVVKFDPKGRELTTIPMGTSTNLRVGQKVLAIGNPFALDRTLTTGIVSALGRPLKNDNGVVLHELIQTDASINPGNSGGPLLNTRGQIIGINTMIYSPTGGSVGIGFAVPVDTARRVVPELIQYGMVKRGWIDVTPVQLFPQLVRYARLPIDKGILVSKLAAGGLAEKSGLKGGDPSQGVRYGNSVLYLGGDIITSINGTEIAVLADLYTALESTRAGDKVKVTVNRAGRKVDLSVTLAERTAQDQLE
ncbi:MAG: trypsin-like peptidase domain-containing protein [Spirochaetales bacterium]